MRFTKDSNMGDDWCDYGLKKYYLNIFKHPVKCSVRINSIIKTRMAVNLIDTKVSRRYYTDTKQHTQISIELLKRPRYKYFYHPDSSIYLALKII